MSIFGNEKMIPLLPCVSPDETIRFFEALGFRLTYQMRRPYLYLVLQWHAVQLHYGPAPKGLEPAAEHSGGTLVIVDEVAPYHEAFTEGMRRAFGKVLGKGLPRLTRYRPGQSRFSLIDPSGNTIIFCRRDERELEYGGSAALEGLAKAVDNARNFRDFKLDYSAAARILDTAIGKYPDAPTSQRVQALAARAELAILLGDKGKAAEIAAVFDGLRLTATERSEHAGDLGAADELRTWLGNQH